MTDKPKRITKKIKTAVDALVAGEAKTVTEAAAAAGITREHLSRELSRPHIAEHLRSKVLRRLAVAAARAGDTKVNLLDSSNELVRDRASSFILGLAGISPETASVAPSSGAVIPGLQIVLIQGGEQQVVSGGPQPGLIEHEPALIEQKEHE
ncbi:MULTISPECIES: hypothetical protein [unclassified Bradyrhizobium]